MKTISSHRIAVAVMVTNNEDKLLLVKNPNRGWEFPGGFVEVGESIKAAAIREVKEESGIDIQLVNLIGVEQNIPNLTTVIILEGKALSGKLTVSDESKDIGYFTLNDALVNMTNELFKDRLKRCANVEQHSYFFEIE